MGSRNQADEQLLRELGFGLIIHPRPVVPNWIEQPLTTMERFPLPTERVEPFQQYAARFDNGMYLRMRRYETSKKLTWESVPLQKNATRFGQPGFPTQKLRDRLARFEFTWGPFKKLSTIPSRVFQEYKK